MGIDFRGARSEQGYWPSWFEWRPLWMLCAVIGDDLIREEDLLVIKYCDYLILNKKKSLEMGRRLIDFLTLDNKEKIYHDILTYLVSNRNPMFVENIFTDYIEGTNDLKIASSGYRLNDNTVRRFSMFLVKSGGLIHD